MALAPLLATAAGLLVVSGASKVRAPRAAETALVALSLPGTGALVRIAGGCELALGAFAVLEPSRVGAVHLILNLAALAASVACVAATPVSLGSVIAHHPAVGIPLSIGVAGAVYAAYL